MISCTEFIPSYSELFTYLHNKHGREEVSRFWDYLFKPTGDGIPLINFVKKEGIHGCFSYWASTLNEEAADFTMYLNEKAGWFQVIMHHCPSKGRLLELKDDIGIEPYPDYCLHCDYYRGAVEAIGLKYMWNFTGVDHAACSWIIHDPEKFDGRIIIDENTKIMDRKAAQNEYFHRDFHSSMNMGVEYLGEKYGEDSVVEYLTLFTEHVYGKLLHAVRTDGLRAIAGKIRDTYRVEHAEDALELTETDNSVQVHIRYCPAVRHLLATGRQMSRWYPYTTTVVMQTLAKAGGLTFTMESYNHETGEATYRFDK